MSPRLVISYFFALAFLVVSVQSLVPPSQTLQDPIPPTDANFGAVSSSYADSALDFFAALYESCLEREAEESKRCDKYFAPFADASAQFAKKVPIASDIICHKMIACPKSDVADVMVVEENPDADRTCQRCLGFVLKLFQTKEVDALLQKTQTLMMAYCQKISFQIFDDCIRDAVFRMQEIRAINPRSTCQWLEWCPY